MQIFNLKWKVGTTYATFADSKVSPAEQKQMLNELFLESLFVKYL